MATQRPTEPPLSTTGADGPPSTNETPPPPTPTYQALGAFDWIGGRIDDGGMTLRLWVHGSGGQGDPADPCSIEYTPTAVEAAEEIRVSVTAKRSEETKSGECPLDLGELVLVIDLAAPVGNRPIFALGTYREFVDVDDLIDLDEVVPPGWKITRDAPPAIWDAAPAPDWSRTWAPPGAPPGVGEPCDPVAVSPITLTEGPIGLHDRFGTPFAVATTDDVAVNAFTMGSLFTESVGSVLQLNWREGDRDYVLSSGNWCPMGHPFPSTDHLVALAQSITP